MTNRKFNIGEYLDLGEEVENSYKERIRLEKEERQRKWKLHKKEVIKKGICEYCKTGPPDVKPIWNITNWSEEVFSCWHCYSSDLYLEGEVTASIFH